MSPALQNPPPHGLDRVALSDLLLVLIVNLGILRLAGLLVGTMIAAARGGREAAGDETLILVMTLVLILFQALVMLGSLRTLILRKYGLTWADLGVRPAPRLWKRRAVLLGVGLIPVVTVINSALPQFTFEPFENPQINALAPAGFSWFAMISMAVMAGIVAPVAEEIAFRGVFYGWLRRRMGFLGAAVISALCFASLHGLVQLIPALTAVGLALAWIRESCGSIWPAALAHGVFNVVMIVALYVALASGLDIP